MTGPAPDGPRPTPEDVITGFWLWVTALPLMVVAYILSNLSVASATPAYLTYSTTAVFAVNSAAVVAAFLYLVRKGYRWARTALTAGGASSVVFIGSHLLKLDAPPVPAVVFGVTAIAGSVAIVGGIFLLHRSDAQAFFAGPPLG